MGCTRPSHVVVKPSVANSLLPTKIIRLILLIGRSLSRSASIALVGELYLELSSFLKSLVSSFSTYLLVIARALSLADEVRPN